MITSWFQANAGRAIGASSRLRQVSSHTRPIRCSSPGASSSVRSTPFHHCGHAAASSIASKTRSIGTSRHQVVTNR